MGDWRNRCCKCHSTTNRPPTCARYVWLRLQTPPLRGGCRQHQCSCATRTRTSPRCASGWSLCTRDLSWCWAGGVGITAQARSRDILQHNAHGHTLAEEAPRLLLDSNDGLDDRSNVRSLQMVITSADNELAQATMPPTNPERNCSTPPKSARHSSSSPAPEGMRCIASRHSPATSVVSRCVPRARRPGRR